jgi:hypothetical protein
MLLIARVRKVKSGGTTNVVQLWERQTQLSRQQLQCVEALTQAVAQRPLPVEFAGDVDANATSSSSSQTTPKKSNQSSTTSTTTTTTTSSSSSTSNNDNDNSKELAPRNITDQQQFYAWCASLDTDDMGVDGAPRAYVARLQAYHRIVDSLCDSVDAALKVC